MHSEHSKATTIFAFVTQPVLAEGLARVLEAAEDLNFLGYCTDPADVADEVVRAQPGLLLLDYYFGLRVVIDLLLALRHSVPQVRTVLWSMEVSTGDRRLALKAGVGGFLDKGLAVPAILDSLRAAAAGRLWTETPSNSANDQRIAMRLTPREREVISLVRIGLKNREIAQLMSITPGTVKVHLMHIFEKTGMRDRHEVGLQAARLLESGARRGDLAHQAAATALLGRGLS